MLLRLSEKEKTKEVISNVDSRLDLLKNYEFYETSLVAMTAWTFYTRWTSLDLKDPVNYVGLVVSHTMDFGFQKTCSFDTLSSTEP